jgi:polyisoprenyl-phosphate glycosyltransferase
MSPNTPSAFSHEISVVIPVYRGEHSLTALVEELVAFGETQRTLSSNQYRIAEILLVFDNGPDRSDRTIRTLADRFPVVRPIWLVRNSGQHAATAAGIASSGAPWVVTMDEDGQHDPGQIARLIDKAVVDRLYLVYGYNENRTPHAAWRNVASKMAKDVAGTIAGTDAHQYTSFRLIEGNRARSACAYVGTRTYLDVALAWTIDAVGRCPVTARTESRSGSGYRLGTLLSHLWTLVLSSGSRPLRVVSVIGFVTASGGFLAATAIAWRKVQHGYQTDGWASVFIAVVVVGGLILFALGVLAEYVGALLQTVQGRPLYVIGNDPSLGPFADDA